MALSIRVDGLDAEGVRLLSPLHPEFDQTARPLLGARIADTALKLKPMLVIVRNDSPTAVVSFSLVWIVGYSDGRRHQAWGHTSCPDAVCGDAVISRSPEALGVGQQRIEANGLVIHRYGDLDAYYDQSKLSDLFSAYVRAKQEWYRGIIEALDEGQSVADAFGGVERSLAGMTERMRSGEFLPGKAAADLWMHQAAGEAVGWRRRYSDEETPGVLKQSIHLEPFVIRRRPRDS